MAKKPEVAAKFIADTKEAEKGINKLTAKVNSFGKTVSGIGNSSPIKAVSNLTNAFTGVGKVLDGVTSAVKNAVAALNECGELWKVQLNAERQLEAAAKNNPYLNGQSVKGLKDFASQLQSVSNYGDEQLLPLMTQLAAAGRTQAEIMDIMGAAVDVAASGTMSLESAVKNLNKTYSGEAGELKNLVPSITGLTKEQLKSGEAVKMAAQAFKGQAAAVADAKVQMANAMGDLKEAIGAGWAELLAPAQKALAGFFGDLATRIRTAHDEAKALKDAVKEARDINSGGAVSSGADDYERLKEERTKLKEGIKAAKSKLSEEQIAQVYSGEGFWNKTQEELGNLEAALQKLEPYYRVAQQNHTQAALAAKAAADASGMAADREKERQEAAAAATARAEEESRTRARLRKSYEDSVAAVLKEIEVRRQLGETVSQEEADRAEYEARYKGYINLIKSANGLISGNYETEVAYREKIAELAQKVAVYDKAAGNDGKDLAEKWKDFQKAIESVNKEFGKESPAKKESERILELKSNLAAMYVELESMLGDDSDKIKEAAAAYDVAAKQLNEAYRRAVEAEEEATRKAVQDAKDKVHAAGGFTEKEEKSKTPLQDAVQQREDALKAEMAALTKSVEWEQFTADQKREIWDSYYADLARMNEEMYDAWNMDSINSMESISETVANATSKISSALQSAGDSAIQRAEDQKNREIAIWEEKYRAGEISEQEYQDKKTELENDAAKKEYQIKNWQWAAQVAEATANIAVGVTKAIAENGWPAGAVMAAMAAAAGAIQLATVVSNKPQPPAFEKGGIVPGTSYSGDKVQIRANSGEGVFTRGQMKALGLMARGEGRKEGGTQVNVENNASNLVGVSPQVDGNKIKLLIDARVNDSMRKGRYSQSMAQASDGMTGKYYGI